MLENTITLSQLESHLWESANILRGPVDAADFKTYIFPLLFFKRICDVWDDEYQEIVDETGDEQLAWFPESHRFQIPEDCHWNDVRSVPTNVGSALQHAMREIEKVNPDTLYGVFGDAQWTNKDRLSDALLKDLIEHFSRISFGNKNITSDVLGDAYEYLIKKFADATNKKAGEFYTPRSVVRLMIDMLDPKEAETIYDPACGTGGMLLAAVQHVKEQHGDVKRLWSKLYQTALADSDGDLSYAQFAENHRFQIPEGAHWSDVRQSPKNVGTAIQKAMRAIESANPDMLDGIFGDAPWTNRERLPDETLKDLIEHFSTQTLSVANVPEDELGNAYEYLIKKFADDSGHTAAEFYTNRTVVHLMTQLLAPQAGESIYDPTCGTGGMLISALDEVKRSGGEYRTLKLYGQERNLITSSIARMNLFLHGVEDFEIIRGDTLAEPKHIEGDRLRQFDVILANPPYSIKQWDREAWSTDKWGRNTLGTPPQGRADYAFHQHILTSLTAKGRCAVLWPHGVLFRNEEQSMRAKMVEQDWVEAVIGLGPNLFYNSPMESCIVICNRKKAAARKGKVIFIDAVNEVTRERAQSFLKPEHQQRILSAYKTFTDVPGFTKVATLAEIGANASNLSIPLYVKRIAAAIATDSNGDAVSLRSAWNEWKTDGRAFWQQMDALVETLDGLITEDIERD